MAKGAERLNVVSQQRAAVRRSEKDVENIRVIYGVHSLEVRIVGKTIASVRDALAQPLNINPRAVALVNGQTVDTTHVLSAGEVLEFVRHAGEKGMGRKTRRALGVEPGTLRAPTCRPAPWI